jgi:hypothetical protein
MLNYLTKLYQLGALPVIRPGTTAKVAVGCTSTTSEPAGSQVVRLVATVDCHVAIGPAPVADGNSVLLPANLPEYFACDSADRIAVIRESSDGALYITAAA